MESQEFKVKIRRSFFDNYDRPLHLHPEFIKFEDKDLSNDSFTIFNSSDIKEFRYGIHWYRYHFVFGREYQFFIRNFNNEVLNIRFVTYFGRKKKEFDLLYENILNSLWNLYFRNQAEDFLYEFEKGKSIQIGEVNINTEGIFITVSGICKQEKKLIAWHDVRTHSYITYFSIYSFENSREINRGYLYKEDWNTYVLYSVVRTILRNKNIETY